MSSVTSSTSTITSPYVTVKEQVRPGRAEAGDKERGGPATAGAAGEGGDASATVSFSEKALDAIKSGVLDVAGAAGDVVQAAEAGVQAVGQVAVDAWHGTEHLAAQALHGIENGSSEIAHLGSQAWQALENGTHRVREAAGHAGDGIKTAAGYVGDGVGEVADAVGNAAGRAASYAAVGAAAIERAFTAVA